MNQVTLLDYARVVWKARWWIILVTLVSLGVSLAVGATRPKVYRATATVLAPREVSGGGTSGSIGALLAAATGGGREGGGALTFPGVSISLPGVATGLEVFAAQLRSRTLREGVLAELDKKRGIASSALVSVDVNTKEKGIVALTVEALDPQLAAELANAYFDHLDQRLHKTQEAEAKRQEAFYISQMERAAREVEIAEHQLMQYQTEHRMPVAVDTPAKGSGEGAGMSLRSAIMSLELQREVMRMRYTDQHPQMREIEKQIAELKRQYSRNLFGSAMELPPESPNAKSPRREFFVSAERATPVQLGYLKVLRQLKIQEAFYTGALQGLQQIRYTGDSARYSGVDRLDPALPPGSPVRPNVMMIVIAGTIAGFIVAVCAVLVREAWIRATESAHSQATDARAIRRGDAGSPVAWAPSPESVRPGTPVA